MRSRIMYIECKAGDGLSGPARIGRVTFSQTGRTLYYRGKSFLSIGGRGISGNYLELDSGAEYWISGCKKRGGDRLFRGMIAIDDDVREEYWTTIRNQPGASRESLIRCDGKYS